MGATLTHEQYERIQAAVFEAAARFETLQAFGVNPTTLNTHQQKRLCAEVRRLGLQPEQLTSPAQVIVREDSRVDVVLFTQDARHNFHLFTEGTVFYFSS